MRNPEQATELTQLDNVLVTKNWMYRTWHLSKTPFRKVFNDLEK
jgi:hypothetical protein